VAGAAADGGSGWRLPLIRIPSHGKSIGNMDDWGYPYEIHGLESYPLLNPT
jgi:hypothetical protein